MRDDALPADRATLAKPGGAGCNMHAARFMRTFGSFFDATPAIPLALLSLVPLRSARMLAACACCSALLAAPARADLTAAQVTGDGAPQALTATPGDAAHGRALLLARENANCILCHALPEARFSGDLGPSLAGVGARLSAAQLRLRVADSRLLHPDTIMPSYFRSEGLTGVAAQYRGKTVLTAQEIEDLVAYLQTLK